MMIDVVQQTFMGCASELAGTASAKASLKLLEGSRYSAGRNVVRFLKCMKTMEENNQS
jgi:hypothetical protein